MAIRIEWDEAEIALLIEACEEVLDAKGSRQEITKRVSSDLRKRAIGKGISIDDVFRNENGIALQMQKMTYLLTHGEKGMPGASKLYIDIANLRESDPREFEKILKRAKEEVEMANLSKQDTNNKALFIRWIIGQPIQGYVPSSMVDVLDKASRYCVAHKVSNEEIWNIQDKTKLNSIVSKLRSMRLFRLTHMSVASRLDKAVSLYKEFLDSREASEISNSTQSEETASRALGTTSLSDSAPTDAMSESEREKLNSKLYSISCIYDDPTGLSLNRIMGLLGQDIDNEIVRSILDSAPWSHKIAADIYSFAAIETIPEEGRKESKKNSAITNHTFYDYLSKTLGLAETTCRGYTSAIHSAEGYAKNHKFSSCRIYGIDTDKAVDLINELMHDKSFATYNVQQHNRFRAAFTKFAEMAGKNISFAKIEVSRPKAETPRREKPKEQSIADFDKDKYIEVLMHRYRNGMAFDSIDFDNFREIYEDFNDCALAVDDAMLKKQLHLCGVFYNDRLFPAEGIMDGRIKKRLFAYIENSFSSGKKILYYKAIFEDLSDDFMSCYTLTDENMLRAFIEFTAKKGKYYFFKDYMSVEANPKIDNTAEVEEFLLSAGKPVKIEDVSAALTHIPQDKIENIIKADSRFRRNAKGEYFHIGIFEISEDELAKIAEIIDGFITENDYAIWTSVWEKIQEAMPVFVENNLYLSALGVRNAISPSYEERYSFEGSVISRPADGYGMRDVYQLYAKHHPTFTSDDVYSLSKELDSIIYFDALLEVSVRLGQNLFVSKDLISFDVDAVDRAIGTFLSNGYIRIREIDSYLAFPTYSIRENPSELWWNEYLLESFLVSYSKKFELLNNGFALYNVAGFVVKKDGQIKNFADACAAFLADSRIELKKKAALDYLAEMNVISRRSYKDIDTVLRRAAQIRAGRG